MPDADRDQSYMRLALRLAARGRGVTSPNPVVGAVLVKGNRIIGQGWHERAGSAHAEINALQDARRHSRPTQGATLYVTLEPCSTFGRTPPCTQALIDAKLRRVVAAAIDPNPAHSGAGLRILQDAGIEVVSGVLEDLSTSLNAAFNHWIVHKQPFVTVKAALTLDGKIATAAGESKWITGELARRAGMRLRFGCDAVLVGVRTILADDPQLTVRLARRSKSLRRVILDPQGRIPLSSHVLTDADAAGTIVVTTARAPEKRRAALARHASVWMAPERAGQIDLPWLMKALGKLPVTHLLVEGGGRTNAAFLFSGFAHAIAFFIAPRLLVGPGLKAVSDPPENARLASLQLSAAEWRKVGPDLLLTARVHAAFSHSPGVFAS